MKLTKDIDAKDRKIDDVLVDTNDRSMRAIPEHCGCDGCFYYDDANDVNENCDEIRDKNGNVGCSSGRFIFEEVK